MYYDVIDSNMVLVAEEVVLGEQEVIDLEDHGYTCFLLNKTAWIV